MTWRRQQLGGFVDLLYPEEERSEARRLVSLRACLVEDPKCESTATLSLRYLKDAGFPSEAVCCGWQYSHSDGKKRDRLTSWAHRGGRTFFRMAGELSTGEGAGVLDSPNREERKSVAPMRMQRVIHEVLSTARGAMSIGQLRVTPEASNDDVDVFQVLNLVQGNVRFSSIPSGSRNELEIFVVSTDATRQAWREQDMHGWQGRTKQPGKLAKWIYRGSGRF